MDDENTHNFYFFNSEGEFLQSARIPYWTEVKHRGLTVYFVSFDPVVPMLFDSSKWGPSMYFEEALACSFNPQKHEYGKKIQTQLLLLGVTNIENWRFKAY